MRLCFFGQGVSNPFSLEVADDTVIMDIKAKVQAEGVAIPRANMVLCKCLLGPGAAGQASAGDPLDVVALASTLDPPHNIFVVDNRPSGAPHGAPLAAVDPSGGDSHDSAEPTVKLPLRSGLPPPKQVYYIEFVISDQTPVRSVVKGYGMSFKVGGIVQRSTTDATKVHVCAATAKLKDMDNFLREINGSFPEGCVSQSEVVESTQQPHISMSYKQFCSVATSNTIISTAKQALSANEGDDLSVSGRASSRGI